MSENIISIKLNQKTSRKMPDKIIRPCDYQLMGTISDMETQVGSVEAYNKLCDAANILKRKIDVGQSIAPHSDYLTNPNYIYPKS